MQAIAKRILALLIRKELASMFIMIFIADTVVGILAPTFSLYAESLGASLTLIGLLGSVMGLTRILASIPMGMISDTRGRKGVLLIGMLLLAATAFFYSAATDAFQLLPVRMLHGLTITATFFIGMAYLGDVVTGDDRGLASGVYTTCMGLGFTAGSWLGGRMAAEIGYVSTYQVAAVMALVGFVVGWWGLRARAKRKVAHVSTLSATGKLGLLAREPRLLAASLGYLIIILMFDAALVNFFPLYAATLLIGQATIGSMFAFRALASTTVRLPTGVMTTRFGSQHLMLFALILGMVMVLAISFLTDPAALAIVLAGEGICFGIYLTAGQTFINDSYGESDRGTAMGIYAMTGSLASMAGPLLLGVVADFWGLRAVFWLTSVIVLVAVIVFWYGMSSRREPEGDRR